VNEPEKSAEPLLRVRSLSKTFPGQVALRNMRFDLRPGEVHALVGQNGSGKSTFIKLLSGYIKADHGAEIDLFGLPVDLWHRDDRCRRIRVVHQDLGLVPTLSATENLGLGVGYQTGRFGRVLWRRENARAQKLLLDFGVTPDVRRPVGTLSAAERTAVAVVRATQGLTAGRGILILDEPTASLNRTEVDALFRAVRIAVDQGVGVIFVSHLLDEVLTLADRITVLRDGEVVVEGAESATLDEGGLVRHIIGDRVDLSHRPDRSHRHGPYRLEVSNLFGLTLRGVSFKVRAGEVLGISGLIGSGRDELAACVFGATQRFAGKVLVDNTKVFTDPRESIGAGMAYVPAERKTEGLLPRHRLHEHVTLPRLGPLQQATRLVRSAELAESRDWSEQVDLQPPDQFRRMEKFSGGNQQKGILARWLRTEPKVLLLAEPTQGVDVGAKSTVYDQIDRAADRGVAVVVTSSDNAELVRLCDRVLVLRGGMVATELGGTRLTEMRLLAETVGTSTRRRGQRVVERPIGFAVKRRSGETENDLRPGDEPGSDVATH
jgi:ribose transport system ATP-binding protein